MESNEHGSLVSIDTGPFGYPGSIEIGSRFLSYGPTHISSNVDASIKFSCSLL